jgi:probable HAF family extracellular repeat protein
MRHTAHLLVCSMLCTVGHAHAALHDRGAGLLYDDALDITWLADANYAKTTGYDLDGRMTSAEASAWARDLVYHDAVRGVDYDDWRLADNAPVQGPNWRYTSTTDGSTDVSYNLTGQASELAQMFYANLGFSGRFSPGGAFQTDFGIFNNGVVGTASQPFQRDVGLIKNLQSNTYWSGAPYSQRLPGLAEGWYQWTFVMGTGLQQLGNPLFDLNFAWAVRDGDVASASVADPVASVPEPSPWALVLTACLPCWLFGRRYTSAPPSLLINWPLRPGKKRWMLAAAMSVTSLNAMSGILYTAKDLGSLGGSLHGEQIAAIDLNNSGQVVGWAYTPSGDVHAFATDANGLNIRDLGTFGAGSSTATAINDVGQIIVNTTPDRQAIGLNGQKQYPWYNNPASYLLSPSGQASLIKPVNLANDDVVVGNYSTGINNQGEITGWTYATRRVGADILGRTYPYISRGNGSDSREFSDLPYSGAYLSYAINDLGQMAVRSWALPAAFVAEPTGGQVHYLSGSLSAATIKSINNQGQLAGEYYDPSGFGHAFVSDALGTNARFLGTLGDNWSASNDVNNYGVVVGYSAGHAFVTSPDGLTVIDLNTVTDLDPTLTLVSANAINDKGQIIANTLNGRAYLLTPVPEPQSLYLALAGLVVIGCGVRARRRPFKGSVGSHC